MNHTEYSSTFKQLKLCTLKSFHVTPQGTQRFSCRLSVKNKPLVACSETFIFLPGFQHPKNDFLRSTAEDPGQVLRYMDMACLLQRMLVTLSGADLSCSAPLAHGSGVDLWCECL